MQSTKQAVFMLGEEEYGLDIMDVNIIEKPIPVKPVAGLPKNFKGIINLRGEEIPLYSLRRKFGLEDVQTDSDTRFIITSANNVPVAVEVDRMVEIAQLEPEQQYEAPLIAKSTDTAYMKSVASIRGRLVILLDHDGVLSPEEQDKLQTVLKK